MRTRPSPWKTRSLPQPEPGTSALLCLPDHVLTQAFQWLDNCELACLRLASRELLHPASAAVTQLKPLSLGDLSTFSQLQKLDLTCLRQEDWSEELLAELKKVGLTSLSLSKVSHLSVAGTEAIASLASRLRSLELTEVPMLDSALQPLSVLGAGLMHLSLRDCSKLTDAGLQVLSHLSVLQSLDLSMCWQLSDATLALAGESLQHLTRIDLAGCERFTASGLRQLCKARSLQTLLMPACWQLNDECMEVVAAGMPQLRCLGLFEAGEHVTDEGLVRLSALTNLTGLDLGYSCWGHTSAGLAQLLRSMRGLQMLNVGGCEGACDEVMEVVAGLTALTMLDASESQRVTQRGVQQLAKLPRLKELNIGWNIRLPSASLGALPLPFPCPPASSPTAWGAALTKLDLSFCGEMGDAALALAARLPCLQALSLRKCTRVGDAGLRHLSKCSTLRRLDLSYCSQITSDGLRHLATLHSLESLVLVDCPRAVTVLGMRALCGAVGLHTLDVSDNKRLDDGCMQALSFSSQLRCLSIRACPKVTDRGLLELSRMTRLRDLDIDLCVAVTPAAVARLQERLLLLKKVRPSRANLAVHLQASNARLL